MSFRLWISPFNELFETLFENLGCCVYICKLIFVVHESKEKFKNHVWAKLSLRKPFVKVNHISDAETEENDT